MHRNIEKRNIIVMYCNWYLPWNELSTVSGNMSLWWLRKSKLRWVERLGNGCYTLNWNTNNYNDNYYINIIYQDELITIEVQLLIRVAGINIEKIRHSDNQTRKVKNNLRHWCLNSMVVLCKIVRCLDLSSLHSFISGYIRNRWNLLYAATNLTTHNISSLPVFTTFSPNSKDSAHTVRTIYVVSLCTDNSWTPYSEIHTELRTKLHQYHFNFNRMKAKHQIIDNTIQS